MTKQRTTPNYPEASRKRNPEVVIAVGVLLVVAACLCALAVFGSPSGPDGSKSAAGDDTVAFASASPSPAGSAALTTTAAVDSTPSKAATASPSKAATATPSASPSKAATATPSKAATATAGGSGSSSGASSGSGSGSSSGSGGSNSGSSSSSSGGSSGSSSGSSSSTKPAKLTCTLSIDAETAGVGTIMATCKVTFKSGATVFDVLQSQCKAAGIPMEFEYTPLYKSAYIEGINGLYEFDKGELSGWMYSVNGWFPNYGCSRYKLKTGDKIRWRYTCDLGKDIGGGDATGQ